MSGFLDVFWVNAAAVAVLMGALWLVSLMRRDASIVDPFWPLGFVMIAWSSFAVADGTESRRLLLAILTTVWGLRLSIYLFWRNAGKGEDFRYQEMRARGGDLFWLKSVYIVFGLQGLLMWVVSLPVQMGGVPDSPDRLIWLDFLGMAVWIVGFAFETAGDWQLARFKADPANKGKVMDRGLWAYTRHPNYFGDFLVWWGLFGIALATGVGAWSVAGPILMSVLLMRVSGAALLEQSLSRRRPGYEEYVARTSAFFPRFPKRPTTQ